MSFRIAATFTDSLARLTGEEQKAAKTTAFDLQIINLSINHDITTMLLESSMRR